MKNSHKFFNNRGCKYFPCHKISDKNSFNCIFCYCPLYFLGDKCGGDFKYNDDGVKSCADCHLPHMPAYYDTVNSKLKEAGNKS
ncbi:MAG: cysteine-rich small domain-containing protein [Oscillospiraceae bacterium]|nr:cysteine-rich small domain-containing protein [Oscillospiraceae bacterium]